MLSQLQAELAEEGRKTAALLAQAEELLVLRSMGEEELPDGAREDGAEGPEGRDEEDDGKLWTEDQLTAVAATLRWELRQLQVRVGGKASVGRRCGTEVWGKGVSGVGAINGGGGVSCVCIRCSWCKRSRSESVVRTSSWCRGKHGR